VKKPARWLLLGEEEGLRNVIPLGECQANRKKVAAAHFLFLSALVKPKRFTRGHPENKKAPRNAGPSFNLLAEEEGFEPPDPVKGLRFSRPVQ
jgi:hypothetical protein